MNVSVVAWSALVVGVALVAYGFLRSGVVFSEPEGPRESIEALSWRNRRTRAAVLFLLGSALVVSSVILLLEVA